MKTYIFAFGSLEAEFNNGTVAVIFDGNERYREMRDMTFADAKAYFPEFLKKVEPGPAQAFISCYSNPKPRGWTQLTKTLNKRD